jgi:hypothetical protein
MGRPRKGGAIVVLIQGHTRVELPPPCGLNPDGTAGLVLPGLAAYSFSAAAALALAERFRELFLGADPDRPRNRFGWKTGICRGCGSGPRPVRDTKHGVGLCAVCINRRAREGKP